MKEIKIEGIQSRTRNLENIKLLKLRDILYDKAKFINNIVIILSLIPILYTILVNIMDFEIFDSKKLLGLDELGVIIALLMGTFIYLLSSKIAHYKFESNILRQNYDCRVFQIRGNKFIIPDKTKSTLEKIKIDEKDRKRYQDWYGDRFINNKDYDVLICQVDNLLYTMYLYSRFKKTMKTIIFLLGVVILAAIGYGLYQGKTVEIFFKFIVPLSPILAILYTTWEKLKNNIYDYKDKIEEIKKDIEKGKIDALYLEAIQDKILINRLNDILAPKILRERYLKEGNEYKEELEVFNEYAHKCAKL